jgi:hypothetical protein
MRALVVYESMYGNTHTVAEAIGEGLRAAPDVDDVVVRPVGEADQAMIDAASLVVVGGPTHAHSMSRESTREQAVRDADKAGSDLQVEPGAEGDGVREWLATLEAHGTAAVAFDTRVDIPAPLSGRASKAIGRALRHHGFAEVARPESFLVTRDNHLEPGEDERARAWGEALALRVAAPSTT